MRVRSTLPVLAAIAALSCTVSTAQAVTVEEIGDGGLRSPRHLDFAPSGNLYVAEAGNGGAGPCFLAAKAPRAWAPPAPSRGSHRGGRPTRIVDGLASYANDTDGDGVLEPGEADSGIGPHGITALSDHAVFVTNGGPTAPRDADGNLLSRGDLAAQNRTAALFGRLLWVYGRQRFVPVADIYDFERAAQPGRRGDRHERHRRPLRPRALRDLRRRRELRAQGVRTAPLDAVRVRGHTGVPNPFVPGGTVDMQAVPTGIVEGRDGAYYMSQLTGFPFPVGGASVYRINPRTGKVTVFAGGFTNIMDLAFDRSGTLYVLEIDSNGLLFPPDSGSITAITRKGKRSVVVPPDGTLTHPGGIAVGKHGDLYVTNLTRSPDSGQVLRITR